MTRHTTSLENRDPDESMKISIKRKVPSPWLPNGLFTHFFFFSQLSSVILCRGVSSHLFRQGLRYDVVSPSVFGMPGADVKLIKRRYFVGANYL